MVMTFNLFGLSIFSRNGALARTSAMYVSLYSLFESLWQSGEDEADQWRYIKSGRGL